jgi:branched-chain amino acid transport system ATP-binding protein
MSDSKTFASPGFDRGISCTSVTVRYGGHTAVQNAALEARAGLITGLIGPNGAGKTTLFNALSGVVTHSGLTTLHQKDISRLRLQQRARLGLGRTFQATRVFSSLTVVENLTVGGRRLDAVIDQFELRRWLGRSAHSLPIGVQREIELARLILADRTTFLLDEPFAGLTESEIGRFSQALKQLVDRGATVLLVEHNMGVVAELCDYLYVLSEGKVIANGRPEDVLKDVAVVDAYLGSVAERLGERS